jgi:hypothetical protein
MLTLFSLHPARHETGCVQALVQPHSTHHAAQRQLQHGPLPLQNARLSGQPTNRPGARPPPPRPLTLNGVLLHQLAAVLQGVLRYVIHRGALGQPQVHVGGRQVVDVEPGGGVLLGARVGARGVASMACQLELRGVRSTCKGGCFRFQRLWLGAPDSPDVGGKAELDQLLEGRERQADVSACWSAAQARAPSAVDYSACLPPSPPGLSAHLVDVLVPAHVDGVVILPLHVAARVEVNDRHAAAAAGGVGRGRRSGGGRGGWQQRVSAPAFCLSGPPLTSDSSQLPRPIALVAVRSEDLWLGRWVTP